MVTKNINKTLPNGVHRYHIRLLGLITLLWFSNATAHEIITRVSVDADGVGGNRSSKSPAISADGRYIAFQSDATNLVADDNNGFTDIFVYDRQTRQTRRVSVSSTGAEGDFVSFFPAISSYGRYVAFQSDATNLVEDDNNRTTDVFVFDQKTRLTKLVSVSSSGEPGDSTSSEPVISANGQYVAFHSRATNLVNKDTNKDVDVFVHDRKTGETTRVSIDSDGKQAIGTSFGAAISTDGRYVAFSSNAANLVNSDKNNTMDVFVHDRETGETTLVSLSSNGKQGEASSFDSALSADGRYVAFTSRATTLVDDDTNEVEDIFVHDRESAETVRVSVDSTGQQANERSFAATLSTDGRYVIFNSDASNLVADDDNNSTDVFIHDRQTGQTRRLTLVSQSNSYTPASSYAPAISDDGRWVAFESKAWNLVANDLNDTSDIFIYDRAYYASYEVSTGVLYIPVLKTIPDLKLFRAKLYVVPDSKHSQFVLDSKSAFLIPLSNIPASYTRETRELHLPEVEVFNPPKLRRFEVRMTTDSEMSVFTVTERIEIEKP